MRTAILLTLFSLSFTFQDDKFQREGKPERRKKLDALEGKAAPEWEIETWINGKTTLKELKGKVVLLDFWGVW